MPLRYPRIVKEAMAAARNGENVDFQSIGKIAKQAPASCIIKDASETNRTRSFIISDKSVDRDNDTIDPNGWILDPFHKNGVVLWSHNSRQPPIATPKNTRVEGAGEKATLKSQATFATEEEYAFADTIFKLVVAGHLKAVSVGFRIMKYAVNEERRGLDISEQELLEYSVTPVGSNPNAMDETAKSLGLDMSPILEWGQKWLDNDPDVGWAIADSDEVHEMCKSFAHWGKTPSGLHVPADTIARAEERSGTSSDVVPADSKSAGKESAESPSAKDATEAVVGKEVVSKVADHLLANPDELKSYLSKMTEEKLKSAFPEAFEEQMVSLDDAKAMVAKAVEQFQASLMSKLGDSDDDDSIDDLEVDEKGLESFIEAEINEHMSDALREAGRLPY